MSSDPKPNDRSDNFLDNQEIAEFLENLESSSPSISDSDNFDDFDSFLNDELAADSTHSGMLSENLPDRITFSDLPSDDEISEIFSEDLSWKASQSPRSEPHVWPDLSDLEAQGEKRLKASESEALEDDFATFVGEDSFDDNSAQISATPQIDALEDELAHFLAEDSFDDNSAQIFATPQVNALEDELANFLAEDSFDNSSVSANSLEDELASFLEEESFDVQIAPAAIDMPANYAETSSSFVSATSDSSDWDELKQLLAGDDEETHAPALGASEIAAVPLPQNELSVASNANFDDLAAFLEEPNPLTNAALGIGKTDDADIFSDLEASLGTPSTPVTQSMDNEFQDLEKLLGNAAGTVGASPSAPSIGVTPRLQARAPIPKAKMFDQTMRVPVKQLDNLSNLIGELVVKRNALEEDQDRLRQSLDNLLNQVQWLSEMGARMHDLYERTLLEGALLASRSSNQNRSFADSNRESDRVAPDFSVSEVERVDEGLDALEMDRFTGFHLLSQEMIELIVRIRESTSDIQFLVDDTDQVTRTLRQATTQLQEGMTKSRMVSFAQTADRLPRAIREVSIRLNKQAKLYVEGKDVLIDKMILEQLYNPMTHLVNNAIAHGIETPEERIKNGKPPEGRVTVRAFIQGNQTVITVSDDGAGINPERVKFKAIEKGLITQAQARALSKQEVYDFLFHPGFSTKDKADDFAGRGVGLDVVYTNLSEIRGTVSIDSAIGKGTTFTIRLPLTLSICKALCCVSERSRIAFPIDGVEDTKDYSLSEVQTNEEGRKCVRWREMELPIYPLSELLNYGRQFSRRPSYTNQPSEDTVPIIFLRSAGNLLALQVDRVLGEQEIVIKQIEGPIPKSAGIAGATVLGDGSVMPIGDVLELIEIAQGRMRTDNSSSLWKKTYVPIQTDEESRTEPTVLIVDDSITVRQLLSLSFGKAGYRVEQARDGQEALEKLQSGLPCDIVFCDIEMPRMNGLELLSHLQQNEKLADLPVALLTSRGAQRHRTVAAKLGASGYFTKPYTERDLLDAAARMLKGDVLLPGSTKTSKVVAPEIDGFSEVAIAPSSPATAQPHLAKTENMVLIVDDSVMVREMLSLTFTKAGYKVERARDGQEAWEKLRAGLPCNLILCDIEMPRMNGLELLSRIQEDERLSVIPMAMITSRGAQKMQNLAADKGAKGYFVKPYIEEVLLDAAKRLIAGEVLIKKSSAIED